MSLVLKRGVETLLGWIRQLGRLLYVSGVFLAAAIVYFLRRGSRWSPRERATWQQGVSKALLRGLDFEVSVVGEAPSGGFIAPNHLGYIDILVLASVAPQAFLSKSDVADWPVIGPLTRMAGTLYIDRSRRSDVVKQEEGFARVMDAGLSMTIFLEGTSSDGRTVLPFRSSLLESVVKHGWPVTPAYLSYECEGGDAAHDICWWGDMGFGSHLLRLCRVKRTRAKIVFGATRPPGEDRKQLARELHESVCALAGSLSPSPHPVASE